MQHHDNRYHQITLPNGKTIFLVRVSAILAVINKPGLNDWRADLGREASEQYAQETRDIGDEIHHFVARLIRQEAISKLEWALLSEEIKNGVRAYERFRRSNNFHPIATEVRIYSLKHGFAGTVDAPGTFGNSTDLEIVDWKSNNTVWEEYIIQVSAYLIGWNELYPNNQAIRARVVNLDRNTGIPMGNADDGIVGIEEAMYTFEHAFLPAKTLFHYIEETSYRGRHKSKPTPINCPVRSG